MGAWSEVEGLIASKLQSIKTLLSMTALEAKLTQLSIAPFMVTGVMLLVVLVTVWVALMGMLGCVIWEMQHRLMWAFGSILLVNVIILFILQRCLVYHLRHMSFQKTRQYIKSITTLEAYERAKTSDVGSTES